MCSMIGNNGMFLGKREEQQPIMSFQTNKNGTFDPVMTPNSGTLIWEVDGVKQTTNTPVYSLIGNTVNVKVYANDVTINSIVSEVNLNTLNVIGGLDFSYFTIQGDFFIESNTDITSVLFSSGSNISDNFKTFSTSIVSLDLSSFTFSGAVLINNNNSLTSVTFSSSNTSNNFQAQNISANNLDLSSFTFSGLVWGYGNSALNSVTFSSSNAVTDFRFYQTSLTSLDLSSFTTSGIFIIRLNALLTSVTFSTNSNTCSNFQANGCAFSSLDLSSFTFSGNITIHTNASLTSITNGSYTTGVLSYIVYNSGLNLSTVNSIFSSLNTFFIANTPIKDLTVQVNGGTNSSPTGGSANTDIVNLDTVVYPNAGHGFIYSIN